MDRCDQAAAGGYAGGILSLRSVLDQHAEALEYDFLHLFGLDVNLLGCESFTYRRFKVLLGQLPADSKYMQRVGGDVLRWDRKDHRLADILDALVQINHNYVQAHTPKRRLKPPKPVRRPGVAEVPAGATRTFKGRAIPLDQLKQLAERWRMGGD